MNPAQLDPRFLFIFWVKRSEVSIKPDIFSSNVIYEYDSIFSAHTVDMI
jgi:hypothetical protein